jgi:U3 small nucleolar RNA-associated protein 13
MAPSVLPQDMGLSMKVHQKTTFRAVHTFGATYTGGKVGMSHDGSLLATTVGEDIQLLDILTGRLVRKLAGVSR